MPGRLPGLRAPQTPVGVAGGVLPLTQTQYPVSYGCFYVKFLRILDIWLTFVTCSSFLTTLAGMPPGTIFSTSSNFRFCLHAVLRCFSLARQASQVFLLSSTGSTFLHLRQQVGLFVENLRVSSMERVKKFILQTAMVCM